MFVFNLSRFVEEKINSVLKMRGKNVYTCMDYSVQGGSKLLWHYFIFVLFVYFSVLNRIF